MAPKERGIAMDKCQKKLSIVMACGTAFPGSGMKTANSLAHATLKMERAFLGVGMTMGN